MGTDKNIRSRLFAQPWLAPAAACFADFFGLNCTVPTLPIFLLAWGSRLLSREEAVAWARTWTGLILTSQSLAKIPGHLLWGIQSAKCGSRRIITLVMIMNAIAFASSAIFGAISDLPLGAVAGLLAVRLFAGFCAPIVPGFCFLFDRQEPGPALVASIGKIGGAILSGLTLGGAVVAIPFGGPSAIWIGVCLLSSGIALLVLLPVYMAPPVLEYVVANRKKKPEGVRTALLSREYMSHGLTSLASGWTICMLTAVPAVHYALFFEFSPSVTALCCASAAVVNLVTAIYVVPFLCTRYCIARCIYVGHTWQLVGMTVLALPWVNRHPVVFPVLVAITQVGLCLAVNPNQNRASTIGRIYTINGTGALTGMSRVLFSCGETAGPLVCINLLYPIGTTITGGATDPRVGTLLPYAAAAAVHLLVLLAYTCLGISPHADPGGGGPPPKRVALEELPAPGAPKELEVTKEVALA